MIRSSLLVVSALFFVIGCGSSPDSPDTTPPDPSTLEASVDFSLVQLSWSQCPSSDFSSYNLYRSTVAGIEQNPGTPIASFDNVTDLTYNDTSVEQDQLYYYALETIDSNELSAWSNEIPVETPVEAQAGYWAGTTGQGKDISFYITTDHTIGQLLVTLDISVAPDITWSFTDYIDYGTNGSWSMSGEGSYGGGYHTIQITGTFTASNLCSGNLIAASEDYYGGYYIDTDFTVYPQ